MAQCTPGPYVNRPMRVLRTLQQWAFDALRVNGLTVPVHLQIESHGTCSVCDRSRAASFLNKWNVCMAEECQRQPMTGSDYTDVRYRPGDCMADPCDMMQCICCEQRWGCRRGCNPVSACIHIAQSGKKCRGGPPTEHCFAQCSRCRQCMCPDIWDKGIWSGASLDAASAGFRGDGRLAVDSRVLDDVFYETRYREENECVVCQWFEYYEEYAGTLPPTCASYSWWGCTCSAMSTCPDMSTHWVDTDICYPDLVDLTAHALLCVNHPKYAVVLAEHVTFLAFVRDQLDNHPHRYSEQCKAWARQRIMYNV